MINTILKYAGNKRSIAAALASEFDWNSVDTYVEPFCGALGSALNCGAFERGVKITLFDRNWELINMYSQVRDQPQRVQEIVNGFPIDEDAYYSIRDWDRDENWRSRDPVELAARTIYLNMHCFNGLFRLNRRGQFNVPWNRSLRSRQIDIVNDHQRTLALLQRASLMCCSFVDSMTSCGRGTLVYCDPPYVDVKDQKKTFSGYVDAFDVDSQITLRDHALLAQQRGARVYISNADCDFTRDIYSCASRIVNITGVRRSLSCTSNSRGRVSEILACFE